jgi:hypothetical protein
VKVKIRLEQLLIVLYNTTDKAASLMQGNIYSISEIREEIMHLPEHRHLADF